MNEDLTKKLNAIGCRILHIQFNTFGRHVYLVQKLDGWDVAMFASDAADLVNGRATLDEIIERNKGADLADPWPTLHDLVSAAHTATNDSV